ncbi:tetratricopeptide repeat protein [Stratiformator vulcanicus]|uniref:Uncharacterized protein n=1 Tax=Stratiformator vulcanicus TaxID=2527980 RepID=A0A517QW99_9PLAN|nr:tetratricopeptide repeat protein [Stratiformator vulcanicus]QDT35942.1 hypothetical protein Pan189_02950 [Stratiformator vulcanicus]
MSRRVQLEQMIAEDPTDPFAKYAYAKECESEGDLPAALAGFDRVIKEHPDYVPAYFQKGQALAGDGEVDDAAEILRAGIEVARRTGDAHALGEMTEFLESL